MAVDRHTEELTAEHDAGVVHQDRNRSLFSANLIVNCGNLLDRCNIEIKSICREFRGSQLGDRRGGALRIKVRDDDRSPGSSELECDSFSQAMAGPGNHGAMVAKWHAKEFLSRIV